jgi:hypothetical protein
VSYRLVLAVEATKVVAAMDPTAHELFVLACLDLPSDPHGMGRVMRVDGGFTTRAFALGALGMIVYVVDEASTIVTVTDVIWVG